MNLDFQTHLGSLKGILPAAGEIVDAIAQIVFAQLQNQLAAFQRRIIQEHRDQPHQPVAAFFRLVQNFALAFVEFAERTGEQEIVVALHHRQRRFQFVRGGSQKYRLLPVHFLQSQVSGEQIPVGDLAFLHQLLDRLPHFSFVGGGFGGRRLQVSDEPIRLRQPANARALLFDAGIDRKLISCSPSFELLQDFLAVDGQNVHEQIQIGLRAEALIIDPVLRVKIREQDLPQPVADEQRPVEGIEQAGDQLKDLLVIGLLVYCRTIWQTALLNPANSI